MQLRGLQKIGGTTPQETGNQIRTSVDRLISIQLFGQAYTFRASGQVSQAEEVINYVAGEVEKARATGDVPSKLDTIILAALNIANDYLELRRGRQDLVRDIDQRCKILIEHIDANG